jgi:hypothetical protein
MLFEDASPERVERIVAKALRRARIPQRNEFNSRLPSYSETIVFWETGSDDSARLVIRSVDGEITLDCYLPLDRIAKRVASSFPKDEDAIAALGDTLEYVHGIVSEILPSINHNLVQRNINIAQQLPIPREIKRNLKEGFAKFAEPIVVESEAKRRTLEKQLRGEKQDRRGGSEPRHDWNDQERACLKACYAVLKPMWLEAKKIAKSAQKSKENTRRTNWREEVLRAYPGLPRDLLERFASPRASDAKPSDLAIIHAKTVCGISAEYSPRRLRAEIKR